MSESKKPWRNLKRVRVTGDLVLEFIKTSPPRVLSCQGIPPDARLLRMGYDANSDVVVCVFEHPSFPACQEGDIPEEALPVITAYYGDVAIAALQTPVGIFNGPSRIPQIESPYRMEKKKKSADIYFYDVIGSSWEGTTAKQFGKDLKEIGDVETLNLFINSPGGSVFDGIAIYNQLARHSAKKIVHVDGYAASIASVIAMVGDEIRIAANGMMMIHDPWAWVDVLLQGRAEDFRKTADLLMKSAERLDKIRDSILDTYVKRTGGDEDKLSAMMAEETWMTADEAVELGFADTVGDAVDIAALAKHDLTTFKKFPKPAQAEVLAPTPEAPAPHPAIAKAAAHLVSRGISRQGQP